MRKGIGLLVALALALLCGCGEAVPEESVTAVELDPNRPKAMMEPVQGGPMLYTFPGREEGVYGLINQDGEVVAEPQYSERQYIYSDAEKTRVIGLVAGRRAGRPKNGDGWLNTYTLYSLDGRAKKLNCGKAVMLKVSPGGRFALVATEQYDYLPQGQGLFDMEANAWVVKPKDGYWWNVDDLVYSDGAIARKGTWDNITEQWYYDYGTGERRALPAELGSLAGYLPEVQWFCFREGDPYYGACRWYDTAMNHMPQLDGWQISPFSGKYALIYPEGHGPYSNSNAWVGRDGNIIPNEENFFLDYDRSWYCRSVFKYEDDVSQPDKAIYTLLDPDLKPVFTGEPGELICAFDGPIKGYALLDKQQPQIKASCDAYGKPLPVSDTPYILRGTNSGPQAFDHLWFLLRGGVLRTVDMKPYGYYKDFGDYFFLDAKIVAACDDFLLVNGWHGLAAEMQSIFEEPTPPAFFALDWDGNPYPDCPLEPFYGSVIFRDSDWVREAYFTTAGEQGPNYLWVEKDGKRGYINTKGEWLFVDEG